MTDRRLSTWQVHGLVLLFYTVVTLFFTWPLVLNLNDQLTGEIGGDTGAYVWNLWVFRHEVIAHGRFPLLTNEVLSLSPPVDLSLHNYTVFADVLAFPMIPWLGVTATFNVIYLAFSVFTAWSTFLLARTVVRGRAEACLVGLLFGFSPILIARGSEHFSLAEAAPLPLFLLALRRVEQHRDARSAAAAGAVTAWAAMCDPYYGIFCILIALCHFATRYVRLGPAADDQSRYSGWTRAVDALILLDVVVVAVILGSGGRDILWLGHTIGLRSLFTPVLLLTTLFMARVWLWRRPTCMLQLPRMRALFPIVLVAGAACGVLLLPVLIAFGLHLRDGSELHGHTYWRSGPPGIDLLALLAPNPNHPLFGSAWRAWLTALPNGFVENVASLPLVGTAVLTWAMWKYRFRPPGRWVAMAVFFGALALGPFVQVAGVNTFIPGPWALLRYVPIITGTRMPTRFAIPLTMVFSLLFGLALRAIAERRPGGRRALLVAVGAVLLFELMPFPRRLHPATVPEVYRTIASDPRDVRVLELPFGFRSGEWSQGDFSAASQFYQTVHQKQLIGGYLSRISRQELERQRQSITVRRLIRLSEGEHVPREKLEEMKRRAPGFVERTHLGYVVIDTGRVSAAVRDF
ncbi:MAG: hypothetical protein ABJA98_33550, partial [Acidobacteriota bacterium]